MKKYFEIYKEIKTGITLGKYTAGEKLASKRTVSQMLGVSVITVQKAYEMLIDEGYIVARQRSGYFVADVGGVRSAQESEERRYPTPLDEESASMGNDFEYSVYLKSVRRVISEKGDRLFTKSPGKGCAVLRNAISAYLFRYRGMYAPPERIIIGSGSEQLYESAVKLVGSERIFGIEDPSYSQIETVYRGVGAKIKKLPMGKDGIISSCLTEDIDVLHVTPFHSYPSGITASVGKRGEYLRWASRTGGYIVEDDFDSEFFLPGQPIESLYSMDGEERVIYINTFSKSISPAVRMGYMIIPEGLSERYDQVLGGYSCTVPVLDQYVLADFISGGHFERHLNRVRRRIKREEQN